MFKITYKSQRKRKNSWFYSLFTLCAMGVLSTSAYAQTTTGTFQIGSGTETISGFEALPATNFDFSYSQQIVKQSDILVAGGVAGNITKLRYYVAQKGTVSNWNQWTVYLGNTNKESFTYLGDFVPLSQLTQVFSGTVTATDNGWMEITFTTPFEYTGGNIVVAVDENAMGWSGHPTFRSHTTADYTGLVYRVDDTNPDPANMPASTDGNTKRVKKVPQLQFEGQITTCMPPTIPVLTNKTNTMATIKLSNTVDDYQIEYGATGFAQGTGTIIDTDQIVTLSSLTGNTEYQYYLRKKCEGNTYSVWSGPYSFTTMCDPVETIEEGFETTPTGNSGNRTKPVCWSTLFTDTGYGHVSSTSGQDSGAKSYYLSNGSDITADKYSLLISPYTENLGNGTKRVKFKARTTSGNVNLILGTMSNALEATTFTSLQTFTVTNNLQEFVVSLPAGTDDFFAFRFSSTTTWRSVYIDDIVYETIPACEKPNNLSSTQLSITSAKLSWGGIGTEYQLVWGAEGFNHTEATPIDISAKEYTLTDIVTDENYQFYVRTNCTAANDGYSLWAGPYNFKVGYCNSVPANFDGDGVESVTLGDTSFSTSGLMYYYHPTVVTLEKGEVESSMDFATGYTYDTHIWIDFDKDGEFNNTNEKVFTGESTDANPTTLSTTFTIPQEVAAGQYRMRIGTADNGQATPNPCYSGSYGVTIDLKINIIVPCEAPNAPTGNTSQTIEEGQSLANLEVSGENIKWYTDIDLQNEVPATTVPTVSGTTYYATQTVNGCESEDSLAVTVEITLSNNELELSSLKVYPNPAKDLLNIDYKTTISQVTVLDINGKKVATYQLNGSNNTISVESLTAGTYFLQIQTEANEISTVKLIKE